ncbi:solute carrier family 31 (copper transporter), member 1, variant 2 [Cryptococcus neoformans var. grubii H99]|uniref:Copper transport protein n=1 Tax=Cryptococcus neoformans (strain H99 / ATCC 208821 / CBS 10515 / FGSC 9487) TaxID=235443 RepID=T2BMH4_CRYN9|nr:solute carrier family 31 (copper transporter), member 1, variant 3 [Cryptococcus neoformans var. grubii H99]XP_012049225.1 solute carrier family 31 (copper transporter), member 1, variant 1 [Cryptococcus neoformans var. grubii H99]XP_012049226.1 solute carrier family 31 (copper transporter), member 1, variant 2 [Cryptococcus neoformans var. grubii H99]AUB24928.1 solute carrier family 31 (copper transporter), member 1 [Cryptococcus neoformans var. grubii]OWZ57515.1 solute carrier family 31 (c|eukprot:XP_012049224.1 solute carrier family 31 (copper transporter), member 1, variant 3 [Cryptococcus neoformans var. grubii H99]
MDMGNMGMGMGMGMDSGHNHSHMNMGSGHGADSGHACRISMLLNFNTVDACFLSPNWHIRSKGMFAGSIIGIFFLCVLIELIRRLGREFDRWLVKRAGVNSTCGELSSVAEYGKDGAQGGAVVRVAPRYVPSWPHQILRGFIYGSQFTAAFFVMLLGMYFNVIVLIFIFLGQTVGYMLFGRDTCGGGFDFGAQGRCC